MLTIPSQIKSIGTFAFSNCQDLKKVIIEEGIERIDNAFNNCESLEEITIPNSLKTIGKDFFSGLKSLKKINIENDNQTFLIDGNCFIRKDNYKLLFAMPNAIIPNYIKSIGFGAFSLTNLKEINIPDSVEEIDEGAFRNSNIEKIVLGSNLKMIGSNAFEYCSNLKKVVIYEGLEEIESYAFSNCYQLESVSLPTSLRKLGDYAFYNCLSSIVLPKTIEKVGNFAFHLCTIYTDFDPDGLREFKVKNRGSFGNFNNYHGFSMCSIFYCCDIEDGFVYSFTFYNYTIKEENGTRTYSSISPVSTLNGAIILEIPYREGWEFVGFTTIMGSNIIEYEPILVEGEFEVVTDFSSDTIIYTKKYYISFDFETKQKVDNNTILYSVWKKVD